MSKARDRRRDAVAVGALGIGALAWAAAAVAAEEDIRDIRGPKAYWPWWIAPAVLVGLFALGLGGYGLWRWFRRRRRPRVLLSHELALQRLEEIRPLMQPANVREFSTAVSDIVRTYIERRFDLVATHRTTEEFLRELLASANASLLRHRTVLSEFLHQCDLVKFAGIALTVQNMQSLHDSARTFVLETARPDPAPAPTATPTTEAA